MRSLAESERQGLADAISIEHFAQGDTVIMQHESGGKLYLLKSGRVDVMLNFNGEQLKLADRGEGAQLGDMSFLDDSEASASIIARENCTAYRLTRDALTQLFVHHQAAAKDLTFSMIQNMTRNMRQMNEKNVAAMGYIQGRKV